MVAKTQSSVRNGIREAWGIVLLALCLLISLSLFSYDWRDISLLKAPPNSPPCNFIGPAGAWLSFLLLGGLGLSAYLVPVWLLVFGLVLIVSPEERLWPKVLWAVALTLSVSGVLDLQRAWWRPLCERLNLQTAAGGIFVQLLLEWLTTEVLGDVGAAILVAVLLLVSLVMFFGIGAARAAVLWFSEICVRGVAASEAFIQSRRDPCDQLAHEERKVSRQRQRLEEAIKDEDRLSRVKIRTDSDSEDDEPQPDPAPTSRRAGRAEPRLKPEPKPEPKTELKTEPQPEPQPEPARPEPEPAKPPRAPERKPEPAPVRVQAPPPRPEPREGDAAGVAYALPPIDLLQPPSEAQREIEGDAEVTGHAIRETLADFGIQSEITHVERGPTVTRYELRPAAGVKVERIANLSNNLALSLKATSVRVQAPIPGKGVVGVEVPNSTATKVYLRELLESEEWRASGAILPLALGKDVGGKDIIADLAAMPHMLIAGATGSGKTVCMNSILAGLLMSRTPDQLQLLLIDPKIVEFTPYNRLPHLVGARREVITDPKKVGAALRWAINVMDKRYKLFAKAGVRNIQAYNSRPVVKQRELFGGGESAPEEDRFPARLPYVVIVVDELADLMLVAQAEIENSIARLAQLSRAVGIHMILATQRPSVNVITGTIKANFPARIAFQVAQKVDSRTILDTNGADKLLGRGDMLFMPPGSNKMIRAQGALTSDDDIRRIVEYILKQMPPPEPPPEEPSDRPEPAAAARPSEATAGAEAPAEPGAASAPAAGVPPAPRPAPEPAAPRPIVLSAKDMSFDEMIEVGGDGDNDSEMLDMAVQIIRETRRASTSSLQRRLRIGYTRAARIMDLLEERGIVGPPRGSDPREILIDLDGNMTDTGPTSDDEPT